jgi:hypothetical protein
MRKPLSFLAILAIALVACERGSKGSGATGAVPAMTASLPSKNGLITVHYPDGFTASAVGASSIVVSRDPSAGIDEAVAFIPIEKPVSSDLQEFARVVGGPLVKDLPDYVEVSSLPASCAGKPGIETTGTWRAEKGTLRYLRKGCFFIDNGHGYSIAYMLPSTRAAEEEPTLRAIREATQFNR